MNDRVTFYGDSISGNCYKLKLAARQLDIPFDWHEIDILAGATRTREFLALNPNGKVPIMVLPDGRVVTESNAILSYLAEGSELAGQDRFERAMILSWLFFEQYSHEPCIATSRFILRYLGNPEERRAELEAKRAGGEKALDVMNRHLAAHDFFANDRYSIADIALYAYTHVAGEGGFDVAPFEHIVAWLERVTEQPGYEPMEAMSAARGS